jgi:hypothetical protein
MSSPVDSQCKSGYEKEGDKCMTKCGENQIREKGKCVVREGTSQPGFDARSNTKPTTQYFKSKQLYLAWGTRCARAYCAFLPLLTCHCMPIRPQCKSGYEKDGDKCVAKCGENQVREKGVCVVRAGTAMWACSWMCHALFMSCAPLSPAVT